MAAENRVRILVVPLIVVALLLGAPHARSQELISREAEIKAGLVAIQYALGHTVKEIAETFQVTPGTIKARLRHADRYQILEHYTESTINQLVPQALAVYQLTMSDLYHEVNKTVVDVATKVLEGTGVIGREKAMVMTNPAHDGEISTIEE